MADGAGAYTVVVLGTVRVPGSPRPLSSAKQHTLACLVARGSHGLTADDLAATTPVRVASSALRMAMVRLRDHLPDEALPDAVSGRYQLQLHTAEVDLWHLRALTHGRATLDSLDAPRLAHLLNPDEVFGGSRHGELLDDEANLVRTMQAALMHRVGTERPELLTGDLVARVEAHARAHPANEQLLALAASCIARVGDRTRALDLLASGRSAMRRAGLSPSAPLVALEAQLLDGFAELPVTLPDRSPRPALPVTVTEQRRVPFVGPRTAIDQLIADEPLDAVCRVSLLVSAAGTGRTRRCVEYLSDAYERDLGIVYAVASEAGDGAFGALVAALPSLGRPVAEVLARPVDTETRRAAAWQAVRQALADAATPAGLALVVDDCQWADSYLLELIAHLARAVPDHPLHLVLSGRPVPLEHPWAAVQQIVLRAGAGEVACEPLDDDAVEELVRTARPMASSRAVAGVARSIASASAGLPGPALAMLTGFDDHLVGPMRPDAVAATHALAAVVAALPLGTRTAGAALAVIGHTATVDQIAATSELTVAEVLDALDDLVRRGLVVERSVVSFDAADVHARAALAGGVLHLRRLQLTARAAEQEDDPHRRARRLAAAVPVVSTEVATHALRASARTLSTLGLHREAVDAFEAARRLQPEGELDDAVAFSRSLELSGAVDTAAEVRRAACARAVDEERPALALRIATSGLPEAEPLQGAAAVIDLLNTIDPTHLDHDDRWRHAAVLARQRALRGDVPLAMQYAERAASLARSAEQQLGAAVAGRMALSAVSAPDVRIALLAPHADTARASGSEGWAEFAVMQAVDHYELGDLESVARWTDELDALGEGLPPLRQWHALLLRATLADDDERFDEARATRLAARRLAARIGHHEGDVAFVGAEFVSAWLRGAPLPELKLDPSSAPADPASTALGLAALTVATAAVGGDALALAETVARLVVDAPVAGGAAALAMVCSHLAGSADEALVDRARSLLLGRANSLLLVGAGVVCLGPATWYAAQLTRGDDERAGLRCAAAELAARSGSRRWIRLTAEPGNA